MHPTTSISDLSDVEDIIRANNIQYWSSSTLCYYNLYPMLFYYKGNYVILNQLIVNHAIHSMKLLGNDDKLPSMDTCECPYWFPCRVGAYLN